VTERARLLDASALLALIAGEAGSERVSDVIDGAMVSAANWAEFLVVMKRRGADVEEASALVRALGARVVPCESADAEHGAKIDAPSGVLSLGDRLCLGTAITLDATVLTADQAWAEIDHGVELDVIR
jgi:ribonuclease VapC